MRRTLPPAGKHVRGHAAAVSPTERSALELPVIAVAQATTGDSGTKFAAALLAALVREGLPVNALVATEDAGAEAQSALTQLAAAGAKHVSVVRTAPVAPAAALAPALAGFPGDELLVVLGNTLPLIYRPFFCVVLNAPRSTHLPEARALRVHADLEVSAPSEALISELARLLANRHRQAARA